jgi:pullulanase/glycogen debranching enzyme
MRGMLPLPVGLFLLPLLLRSAALRDPVGPSGWHRPGPPPNPGVVSMDTPDWEDRVIYNLMTDRFALNEGIGGECNQSTYCGGGWKGVCDRLDYIKDLGFDAIQFSPISANIEDG